MANVARINILLVCCLLLQACGSSGRWDHRADTHIVRKGETLYAIAFRYDRTAAELAAWNRLGDGSRIYPGQLIRLTPPARGTATQQRRTAALPRIPAQPSPTWSWPTAGSINVPFGGKPGPGTGVLINGKRGQWVRAAADGEVVYAGSGLIGYGQLVIIKHNDTYLSAYGYNETLLVKDGERIARGQRIARMGDGPERKPRLHFEIRRNGTPVDPQSFLPGR